MLKFEGEPAREPEPAYGNDVFRAMQRALALDLAGRMPSDEALSRAFVMGTARMVVTPELAIELATDPREWLRPDGIITLDNPCGCDICRIQQDVESTRDQIDRIMAGVDMPGRIVDDVRPDQRGGE